MTSFYETTPRPRGNQSLWDAALLALPLSEYTVFIDHLGGEYADVTCTRCMGKPPKHLSTAVELPSSVDMSDVLRGMLQHEAEQHGGIPYE